MNGGVLILTPDTKAALADLRRRALAAPQDARTIRERTKDPAELEKYRDEMNGFTVDFQSYRHRVFVTYSIEFGHPCGGEVQHISISVSQKGKVPTVEAAWEIAEMMGFVGGFEKCAVWPETLADGEIAINIAQPIGVTSE